MSPVPPKLKLPARPRATPSPSSTLPLATGPGTPFRNRRAFVYAGGFTVITICGALIGATLKSREQAEERTIVKQKVEVDAAQQIAVLEATKLNLLQRKKQLEGKIGEVREKQIKEEEMRRQRAELRAKGEEIKRELALGRGRGG